LIIKAPKIIPPNKDISTFLEYIAKNIAKIDGKRQRDDNSIIKYL